MHDATPATDYHSTLGIYRDVAYQRTNLRDIVIIMRYLMAAYGLLRARTVVTGSIFDELNAVLGTNTEPGPLGGTRAARCAAQAASVAPALHVTRAADIAKQIADLNCLYSANDDGFDIDEA